MCPSSDDHSCSDCRGLVRLAGYLWWKCSGRKPTIPPEKVAFLRSYQMAKIAGLLWGGGPEASGQRIEGVRATVYFPSGSICPFVDILGLLFAVVSAALLLCLPRRQPPFAILLESLFMTAGQVIKIGPFHFTILRLLIAVGFLRILIKGERISGGLNSLDRLVIIWASWAICSSLFHSPFPRSLSLILDLFTIP